MRRIVLGVALAVTVAAAGWFSRAESDADSGAWREVAPGVYRTATLPAAYALVADGAALVIDAPDGSAAALPPGADRVEHVLLTHHHRDTLADAVAFRRAGATVRAPAAEADWIEPEKVRAFWAKSIPLRDSRTAYFVLPEGTDAVECSLEDGQRIKWRGWDIRAVATPGHSRGHLAFAATRAGEPGPWVFCGDAVAAEGKLWTPFVTDWDHWTDAGQKPAAESLRKLAELEPRALLPARGPVVIENPAGVLARTAEAVGEVGSLKSYERFTDRMGDVPEYAFLAEDQVATGGQKPWTRVSEHLWITGNTYALVSERDRAFLVIDPWAERSADQVARLKADQRLGPLEVVWFSHAHYDHFDGLYHLPDRERFQVWGLDLVAAPLRDPFLLRAPFLDERPIRFDRTFAHGDTATWREYEFRFTHLSGQSDFTMGVQTRIDGKDCFFTADNFFHHRQFSGTGGWMGLNRASPLLYASSAKAVLDAKPDWVLAEHGGPFVFDAEDFRRRVLWGEAAAGAADAVCVTGDHRRDWNPHRVRVEPLAWKARPGEVVTGTLVVDNPGRAVERVTVRLDGRGLLPDQGWDLTVAPGRSERSDVRLTLPPDIGPGLHVFALRNADRDGMETVDSHLAVIVAE